MTLGRVSAILEFTQNSNYYSAKSFHTQSFDQSPRGCQQRIMTFELTYKIEKLYSHHCSAKCSSALFVVQTVRVTMTISVRNFGVILRKTKCSGLISSFYRPQPNDDVSLEKLNQSLKRLNPNSKSIIIVSGDFNLGHIDWTSSSIIPGKPNVKQHQEILDIIADHSLTQIVDKPTRNDLTLDLIITNYPSIVDNFETIPPIGEADHDILSLEITVSLRRCKHKPRQVLKYSKANWDNIKQDLKTKYHKINQSQDSQDIDSMWNLFKDSLQMSISKNIPTKTTKYDNKLPWISDELRKKMNKYRRKQSLQVEGPRNREISLFLLNKIGRFLRELFKALHKIIGLPAMTCVR